MKFGTAGVAAAALLLAGCNATAQEASTDPLDQTERNKQIARQFYEELWFSQNTEAYADFVADEYVVHDIGARKNVTEPAIEQKITADRFHSFGNLSGRIDYQIAEDDKVATRWFVSLEASPEAQGMGMTSFEDVPIINVFRFNEEGKIVEIWNHRHDVDLPRPNGPPPEQATVEG